MLLMIIETIISSLKDVRIHEISSCSCSLFFLLLSQYFFFCSDIILDQFSLLRIGKKKDNSVGELVFFFLLFYLPYTSINGDLSFFYIPPPTIRADVLFEKIFIGWLCLFRIGLWAFDSCCCCRSWFHWTDLIVWWRCGCCYYYYYYLSLSLFFLIFQVE